MNTQQQQLQHWLEQHRDAMLADWQAGIRDGREQPGGGTDPAHDGIGSLGALYTGFVELVGQRAASAANTVWEIDPAGVLATHLRTFVAAQALLGEKPDRAVHLVMALKRVLMRRIDHAGLEAGPGDRDLRALSLWLDDLLDRVAVFAVSVFVDSRERIIAQQSDSLLELSTPVLRLWHQVLLLPLVGVVDTARARQFTERLLEAVTRFEALVTIIDVTGVPVLDTSVARHLMKTIDAARLLGTRIVMTGISPEGAQTLTKLGIRFGDVVCRASLRAGIAEALFIVGRRIVPAREDAR